MLTLYGTKGSGSAAIEIALKMVEAEFRVVDPTPWKPGPGLDELKRVNPLGQLPTLVLEDGSVLTESAAILIHLGMQFPQSGLLPADSSRRAQVIRGLVFIAANCYAAVGVLDYPERWCSEPDAALRERIISQTKRRLYELWDLFADMFPASPWLCGERLGALDVLAVVVSKWDGARTHIAASRPGFRALLERIEADPNVVPVFARYWPKA
jgi:GST-like protein